MMTRYFIHEFMYVEDFLGINSAEALIGEDTLDGKVITLYSFTGIKQEVVKRHLLNLADKRLVVVCPKRGLKAQKQLKDYEIIRELRDNQTFTNNNEILKKELPLLLDDLTVELEQIISSVYEEDSEARVLYFNGESVKNAKAGNEESAVNECCLQLYTKSPIINNEMVNRASITTAQTKKARINIIQAILSHLDTPDFYVGSNQEATVYRALFDVTGITKGTHIICHHYNNNLRKKGLILWVAHTTELLEQAYGTFCSVWRNIGNGSIHTYKLWGDYNIEIPQDGFNGFMVCGIQKLQGIQNNNIELFQSIVRDTRLLVYDEAHKASATETRNTIEKIMTRVGGLEDRALMGLSATPGRTTVQSFDNNLLVSMFGNKIISIDTKLMNAVNLSVQEAANTDVEEDVIKYFQKRGVLSKIIKEELTYPESLSDEEINKIRVVAYSQGYDDFSKTALETIGKNKSRNLRIMQKLRELNSEKKPTIVFACSVKHAQLLSAMLTLEDIPNAVVYGFRSQAL